MAAELRFRAMGSDAHVIVVGDTGLLDVARRRVDDLERRWSRFLRDSEVSRLNAGAGRPRRVSPETFALITRAVGAWHATGGRFDPTVLGDLTRAGYDRPFQAVVLRPGEGVSSLRRNCGGIRLDPATLTVTLPADAGFDPGGIGKGLAADLVAEELLAAGAEGSCVNLGGDVRAAGEGPDGRWVIAIDHPTDPSPASIVAVASGAVATSTTLKRSWTVAGERRHHLIDPRTGLPAQGQAAAVSAIAAEAADAEVAAKVALLASPGQELATLDDLGCPGLVVTADGAVRASADLRRFQLEPAR